MTRRLEVYFFANESRCVDAYAIGSLVNESQCAARVKDPKPNENPISS
jgi:hypothetical protein